MRTLSCISADRYKECDFITDDVHQINSVRETPYYAMRRIVLKIVLGDEKGLFLCKTDNKAEKNVENYHLPAYNAWSERNVLGRATRDPILYNAIVLQEELIEYFLFIPIRGIFLSPIFLRSWLYATHSTTVDAEHFRRFFKILGWTRILKNGDAFCGDKPCKSQVTKIWVEPDHARAWKETLRWYIVFLISSSSSFGTAPKIEERGQVLRGQALQVPMLLSFTIMGTDSAGTSSIERVQHPKCIFWTRWIGSYHNVSKDYRLSMG